MHRPFLTECTYLLQEAEKLKHENEELRKLGEDAVLDQQLNKALQETDKLKLAADAYKKELLQQKVSELQAELAQTTKRLKAAEEQNTGSLLHDDQASQKVMLTGPWCLLQALCSLAGLAYRHC